MSGTRLQESPGGSTKDDSDELDFRWQANPALAKGVILLLIGGFILVAPEIAAPVLRFLFGIGLVLFGLSDIWANLRDKARRSWADIGLALLAVLLGALLLVFELEALAGVILLLGAYLVLRGLVVLLRLLFRRSTQRVVDVVACGLQLAIGATLLLAADIVVQALIGVLALAAVIAGGVIIGYSQRQTQDDADIDLQTLNGITREWIETQDVGDARRAEISDDLYFEQPNKRAKLGAWWTMLLLSTAIATYGILQDSTAVVIGAMLIAPLMTPIVAASAAIVNGRTLRLARSMLLVAGGVAAAVTLAFIIGRWSPTFIPLDANSQVTSRTSPNVIDMAIALAAGAAGAFAIINARVASGLAGVAIAVALVPPLGVVGLTLEATDYSDSWGAFLLFLTNLVAILLSATVVFSITGWTSVARIQSNAGSIALTMGVIIAAALIILVPLMFTSQGLLNASSQQSTVTTSSNDWFRENAPELTVNQAAINGDVVSLAVSGPTDVPDPTPLAQELSDELGMPVSLAIGLTPTELVSYTPQDGVQVQKPSVLGSFGVNTTPTASGLPTPGTTAMAPNDDPSPQPSAPSSPSPRPSVSSSWSSANPDSGG